MNKPAHNTIKFWAVAVWILVWYLGSYLIDHVFLNGHLFLPSPTAVFHALGKMALTGEFWRTIGWSTVRIFGGFLAATAAASLLAVPSYRFRPARELLAPVIACMKTVPVASFIILALVWLKSSQLSFFIAFLMVFPPVYLGVLTGIGQTDPRLLEMAKVFQVPFWRQVRYLYLPAIAPHFRSAVSVGLGLCWKSGIAAEVIGLPDGSMGERLYMAKVYYLTPELFAWTAVIVAVSVLFEKFFLRLVDKALGKAGGSHAP